MSGAINMGTSKITNMGTPTVSTDAATKGYVDTVTVAPSNLTGPITSVGNVTSVAAQTGTGSTFVMQTSPTLTTPNIGVATATSVNGTTIPTSKTLVVTTDKISALAATTSAELAGVISDETGTGALVFANTPTLVTPVLGVATATSVNGTTIPTSATLLTSGGALGTPSSGTLTNATGLPISTGVSGLGTNVATFLATPTSANLASAVTDETGTGALVFGTSPAISDPKIAQSINAQTGTTYTFVLADQGKYITASNASAQTYSIPTNASVAFPIGTSIDLIQIGAGQVTVSAASSGTTTIYSTGATAAAPKTRVQYSALTCKKVATDTWHIIGDIA
jgi:hypothetical protein